MTDVTVLGKGTLAITVAAWFAEHPAYELTHVVPVIPEPDWTDSLAAWAGAQGVTVIGSGDVADHPSPRIGLAFSVFYDRILSPAFLARCGRAVNLHNSPLPRYRGVRSINWALRNGEDHHGVTLHEIAPGIDDGPIIAQVTYPIWPERDEVQDVYDRANAFSHTLLQQTLPLLHELPARPQDERLATYFGSDRDAELGDRRALRRETHA